MSRVALVVAMADNGVIGRDNGLPWRLPADLQHFKALTMGKPVVMGRRTWESIGRPLPGRHNIVVSRDPAYSAPGCTVVHSVPAALEVAADAPEVMVIGGAQLYRETLDRAERIYLTRVRAEVEGDTRFPDLDADRWRELSRESHQADERNQYDYDFVVLERVH